jgi:hypothetical protein
MRDVVVGVVGTLSSVGAKDIELLIHSHNLGNPSPCYVYENSMYRGMIGGSIGSLDEMLQFQVAQRPGYVVKARSDRGASDAP